MKKTIVWAGLGCMLLSLACYSFAGEAERAATASGRKFEQAAAENSAACAKLGGTERIHCLIGPDAHRGPLPAAAPANPEPQIALKPEPQVANPCYGAAVPEARNAECRKIMARLDERIKALEKSEEGLSRECFSELMLTKALRDDITRLERVLADEWFLKDKEAGGADKVESKGKGSAIPIDEECVPKPGRIPHCPPVR